MLYIFPMAAEAQRGEVFVFRFPMPFSRRVIAIVYAAIFLLAGAYLPLHLGLTRFSTGLSHRPVLLLLYAGFFAALALFVRLAFPVRSAQPELHFRHDAVRFVPSKLNELLLSECPIEAAITPLSREILLCHSFLEELPDGYRVIIRAHDDTEREVRVGHSMPLNAQQWRRFVDGITDATSLPVRLVVRRRLASGSVQETPWMASAAKPKIFRAHVVLAICSALLPYFGGFLVIGTRNMGSLALAGAVICVLCTSAAYLVRRQRDPVGARYRLIVDPLLYSFEFAFTATVVRYLLMR
jgi:hypothetical protein